MPGSPPFTSSPEASNTPGTTTARQTQVTSRFSQYQSLDDLTARYLKDNYLTGLTFAGTDNQALSNSFFEDKIANAIARFEDITSIDILQRQVDDEQHDYYVNDYLNYAFLKLYRTPAAHVSKVEAVYPTGQTIQVFPHEWVRLNVEGSQIHLVPTSGSLAQVMLGGGNGYLPFIFAGLGYLPNLWHVYYQSGFKPGTVPRNIISAICKLASIEVLTIMSDLIGPIGVASSSLSLDGMSQSMARQLPAFKARIESYKVDLGLPGPGLGVDPKYNTGEIGQLRRTYFGIAFASV